MDIHTAPPNSGTIVLGKTLPDLLDEACTFFPNDRAFNQREGSAWRSFSNHEMRDLVERDALGLLESGLRQGDRVAMLMHSDVHFVEVDLACLLAGLIDVPLYTNGGRDLISYAIRHSGARALVVSDEGLLAIAADLLPDCPDVEMVVAVQGAETGAAFAWPETVRLEALASVRDRGEGRRFKDPGAVGALKETIHPHDTATIIYTSGTTGIPKGVVLSHENISFNGATSFTGLQVGRGSQERAASFLPMSHIFARTMTFGCLHLGFSMYFLAPDQIGTLFPEIRPTIFATVPRMLERIYDRIQSKREELSSLKKAIFDWSMRLARRYDLGRAPSGLYAAQLAVADRLVYSKWRQALGGEARWLIVGGAALHPELTTVFSAAGLHVLQGYGLTETSPVITYNRADQNRPGAVGKALPGVEVALAEDGEVLTRGPHVMREYYLRPDATAEVFDADGWFHTGDIGEWTDEGFLRITDRKKALFKLSTGKYVVPQPLENRLMSDPKIENAVVIGPGYKYCSVLLFVNEEALRGQLAAVGLPSDVPLDQACSDDRVVELFRAAVRRANEGLAQWETAKRFALIPESLSIDSGFLTPTLKVKRNRVVEAYRDHIEALYRGEAPAVDDT